MKYRWGRVQDGLAQVNVLISSVTLNLGSYGQKPLVTNGVLDLR